MQVMLLTMFLCLGAFTCAAPLPPRLSPALAGLCWWPVLSENRDPPSTAPTQLAQSLLNGYLKISQVPFQPLQTDGVFGPETVAAVEAFRRHAHLEINGFLDETSWPSLVKTTYPLARAAATSHGSVDAPGSAATAMSAAHDVIAGLQQALVNSGFLAQHDITGAWSNSTTAAVETFKLSRGNGGSGKFAGYETFHLVASECNSSRTTQAFWFDAGWPQGVLSVETLKCLGEAGFRFATFECWREYSGWWKEAVTNVANARAAGFEHVGVYMFPIRAQDPSKQVPAMLAQLSNNAVEYDAIMLDIEGKDWGKYSAADNRAFMMGMRQAFDAAGVNITVYCGHEWRTFFGQGFDIFKDVPLVYAHYDNVPSFYDFVDDKYGGWESAAGKQFWDGQQYEQLCGTGALDWDWSPRPFWGKQ